MIMMRLRYQNYLKNSLLLTKKIGNEIVAIYDFQDFSAPVRVRGQRLDLSPRNK